MLIPLGILDFPTGGAGAYELIESNILTSSASSVTFSSIPQDYKHLQIRATVRPDTARSLKLQMNGVTGTSYAWHALRGNGSTVASQGLGSRDWIQTGESIVNTSSIYAPYLIDILDYSSTSKNTTARIFYGQAVAGDYWIGLTSGLFDSTNAISSLNLYWGTANHTAGTRISLYGIRG